MGSHPATSMQSLLLAAKHGFKGLVDGLGMDAGDGKSTGGGCEGALELEA